MMGELSLVEAASRVEQAARD